MVNSPLDNVNELLRLVYGDKGRLEDIKRRLEHDQTLYNSDIEYLQKLVNQYGGEIQKIMGSKTSEPQPEPQSKPQPEPQPEPQSKPQPKKKSSKKKKVGIAFGVIILLFFVLVSIPSDTGEPTKTTPTVTNEQPKVKSYNQMNEQELELIKIDWQYRDLMRNFDDYSGKIIFVDGQVTNVQRDVGSINLCTNGHTSYSVFSCDEFMFVNVNGITTWLEDDRLGGYVEVKKLSETGSSNMFTGGEWVGSGEYVPDVKEIKLTCSNC